MNVRSLAVAVLVMGAMTAQAEARDQLSIVGSSTVFPFTQAVSEEFANKTGKPAPIVESTGTGGGMKNFCQGLGDNTPDLTGASRAMKGSEWELCASKGVTDISELLVGYDGIVLASAKGAAPATFTRAQLFLALAAEVPVGGKLVKNPYKKWNEIDNALPNVAIQVWGPPPTSGTRDAWVELVMEEGCEAFPEIETLDKEAKKMTCSRMRQDGPFIEAGEQDNVIVKQLGTNKTAFGIFGYSFLYENEDQLQGSLVDGVAPSLEAIADGSYPVSRPLYLYAKNAHRNVIPGMQDFIVEYASEDARGPMGYLSERGLIAAPDAIRIDSAKAFIEAKPMAALTN